MIEIETTLKNLKTLIEKKDVHGASAILETMPAVDGSMIIDRLSDEEQEALLMFLPPTLAAEILAQMHESQAVDILDGIAPDQAADIVQELDSDAAADLLGLLEETETEAILQSMEPEEAADTRKLLRYNEDTAGGLMRHEYLSYPLTSTVGDVIEDLREHAEEYSDFDVQYAYLVDEKERLEGVLRLRDLLLSTYNTPVTRIMIPKPMAVHDAMTREQLTELFQDKQFIGLPVVDEEQHLLGVVLRKSVRRATADAATEDFLKVSGLGGREELRSMPLQLRSRRRLSWLSINIVLNVLAASVIAFFQDTLAQVIALAVFLPIISDMSGCSGSQAVAVSIRELTLGLVRPTEMLRVFAKEIALGMINGLVLGILIALVALLWKGNPWLGMVVGGALMINTMVAVSLGGLIPLALKRMDMDPALASGPILTTVTDMCGFFLVLSLATFFLPRLVM